jgi:Protein of unknown function (DUF2515)
MVRMQGGSSRSAADYAVGGFENSDGRWKVRGATPQDHKESGWIRHDDRRHEPQSTAVPGKRADEASLMTDVNRSEHERNARRGRGYRVARLLALRGRSIIGRSSLRDAAFSTASGEPRQARVPVVDRSAEEGTPGARELVPANTTPDTIAGWKSVSDSLLSHPCCAFHRNVEISLRYVWIYRQHPTCFKWAAMAAIASHHVRLALVPLRLDTDRAGYVDIPRSLGRRRILMTEDVNTIRATNNAIFDDIFWVHLAYLTADHGIEFLRTLLRADSHYAAILSGFEAIDQGRRVLEDATSSAGARQAANDLIWAGNLQLLEHEQRAVVQPNFDRLSCAFARIVSIGAVTRFEVRGARQEIAYSTSFYLNTLTSGLPHVLRAREWPRITRFDDRWRWLETSVVPRFRRFDADMRLVDASLRRIRDEARHYASMPCVLPPSLVSAESPTTVANVRQGRRAPF